MHRNLFRYVPAFALLLLLSACGTTDISPEAVAVNMLRQHATREMTLYPQTIFVPQTLSVDEGEAIVVLTYQGNRPDMGEITCFSTYQTVKGAFGWQVRHSTGTCRQQMADPPAQALEMSAGRHIRQRAGSPEYSLTSGLVHDPQIVNVRITWDDQRITEAEVVNGTVISLRDGQAMTKVLEGLDPQGQVLYSDFQEWMLDDRP